MKTPLLRLGIACSLLLGFVACDDSDTTTAPGAFVSVRLNVPDSVRSGREFTIDVAALNIGINGVHNGRVTVTLPAPLTVNGVDSSAGTSAMVSNGSGATVSWELNTLDSNSQSKLHIRTTGVLPGSASMTLTLRAELAAERVRSGDAVAETNIHLMP